MCHISITNSTSTSVYLSILHSVLPFFVLCVQILAPSSASKSQNGLVTNKLLHVSLYPDSGPAQGPNFRGGQVQNFGVAGDPKWTIFIGLHLKFQIFSKYWGGRGHPGQWPPLPPRPWCGCTDHYTMKSTYFQNHTECFIILYLNATLKLIKNCINAKIELLFNYCNITTKRTSVIIKEILKKTQVGLAVIKFTTI